MVDRKFDRLVVEWKEVIQKLHATPAKKMEEMKETEEVEEEESVTKPRMILDKDEWRGTHIECTCDHRWNIWTEK